jgi:acyl carrier protein
MSVIDSVTEFLVHHECIESGEVVDNSESLLERGIIDSVIIMKMVSFLEEKYGIIIYEDDLMPENFDSLAAIDAYVQSKTN